MFSVCKCRVCRFHSQAAGALCVKQKVFTQMGAHMLDPHTSPFQSEQHFTSLWWLTINEKSNYRAV